ncbi:crossover junction endodeoxyribonuclease RusA [Candidatus Erwinia dacicola]|uniref:Crossover junction endodeoxyribonuclease RusA n=1 Tax=Candidatus Erwinia dacicola TaxID=252393 RepID=A0A328TVY4_9GAMM|nr:crossover junction endodeoxyribonuclease RusA [Candidatus Erwinia dacicola]
MDNLPKAVFDALTSAGFWLDDGQIDDMRIKRCQAIKGGMLVLVVTETCGSLPMITELLEAA